MLSWSAGSSSATSGSNVSRKASTVIPAAEARRASSSGFVEVVAAYPQHVATGDRVARRVQIDDPHLRTARLGVEHFVERHRHELARLHRDHHAGSAREQVLRRAVAEVARVLHVDGDRIRAAQFVAHVLRDDRRLQVELVESLLHPLLEDVADVDLGDAQVAVGIVFDVGELCELVGIEAEHDTLGDHGDAVATTGAQPLDDGADQCVDDLRQAEVLAELLGDQCERGSGRLAHPESEMSRLAAHRDHEVPARRRLGVDHEVLDDLDAVVACSLETEGVDPRREVEVVVDGLRCVYDADTARCELGEPHRRKGGVVATDGDELRDTELLERRDAPREVCRVFGRVGAGGSEDRTTAEVDAADTGHGQFDDVVDVTLHDPLEAVADADDLHARELGADRRRADDAVDARRRSTADKDGELAVLTHRARSFAVDTWGWAQTEMSAPSVIADDT